MKDYPLTMTKNYVANWSVEDAVREIVQNAIPAGDAEYYVDFEKGSVTVFSPEVKLHQSVLLLGSGTKTGDETQIGGFSEGLKLALLILSRNSISVSMKNHDVLWEPVFKEDISFGCEMFFIQETDIIEPVGGLKFTLTGFTKTELENIVERNLPIQDYLGISYGKVTDTSYGRILHDKEGYIYVGGLYVCVDSSLEYGYDFKPEHLPLNRDRQTVPNWELKTTTARMWAEAVTPQEFVKMIVDKVSDIDYTKYCHEVKRSVSEEALKVFKETYGDVPVTYSIESQREMKRKGFTNTVLLGNDVFTDLIRSAPSYEEVACEEIKTVQDIIDELFDKCKTKTEFYEHISEEAENWEIVS